MSNVLTPIVERYSLFFTLAMFSSSSISRSKQPTHLVQTLLLEAQQRYQDKSTEKLRALIRHLSTTSTSSSSLSQSATSQLTSPFTSASAGSGSTEISSPSSYIQPALSVPASSSLSTSTSRIEPPSSHLDLKEDMPSLPPVLEQKWQEGSFPAAVHNNNNNNNNNTINQSSEHRIKDKEYKATPLSVSTLDRIEQKKENNHSNNHSSSNHSSSNSSDNHNERGRSRSAPCSPPLIGDGNDDATDVYAPTLATVVAANVNAANVNAAATVGSDRPDQQTSTHPSPSSFHSHSIPVPVFVSISSPSSSSITTVHVKQQHQQQGSNNNNNRTSKVNKSSIAALLSVTLTMILLSLLQSKKRHIRRKSRSPRGTTSKRHSRRGSRHLLGPHREGYKSTSTDQFTHRSHSPSSSASYTNTNTFNTYTSNNSVSFLKTDNTSHHNINMEGASPSLVPEGKSSSQLLTQYGRPASFFGGGHGGEPTSVAYHINNNHHHLSSLPPSTHGLLDNMLPSSPSSNPSYPPNTLHFDPTTRLSFHQGNMYSGRDIGYSLSDTNLPEKRSKRDLVSDWLNQQTFVAPSDMVDSSPEEGFQDGPNNSHLADDREPFHQLHRHHAQTHHLQQQQQQQHQRQSFPAQMDPHQLYHQHSINNTGAQREPRQQQQLEQQQHQYPRAIQRTNELYPGSRSSLYRSSSVSRHSMVALDQQQQQQQQQQSSFWRESQSQLQSQQQQQQFSPHQYRPQYPPYPQQQHLPHPHPHPQHAHPAHYGHYQQQYHQPGPASPPAYHPPYEPLGYEDLDQQDANHSRSLSFNNSSSRRGGATGSRPQSQVYRKATPARFENLSLAEQARQEHQMRRQHYQQHYHQHRQQQQQHQQFQHQQQHQQYYQAPGSRPESMYSNGHPAAAAASPRAHSMGSTPPREGSQFVPPRHPHQAHHPRPQIPSIVTHHHQQQHRHPSDVRHSVVSVSSPKSSSVSRSAHDLAWERHCYYQQQQMQEDALAERKRIEQQQQQQQQQKKEQRPLSLVEGGLQVPLIQSQLSSVVRTSSMSRISSISTTAVTGGNTASNIGRRTAVGKVALGSSSSSGLSRSVSTSAIAVAKMKANTAVHAPASNKKNKSSHPHLEKKNSKELAAAETETKSTGMDYKFLRLFRSDSKLSAKKTLSANNTESQQVQSVGNGGASSKEHSTVPVIVTIQPLDSATTPPTPTTTAAATGLNRRRTLKDLAPSIRSLARRCSSRFSNSSTRPNSFAGSSSDPVIQFTEREKAIEGSNSLSMTTSYLPLKLSLSSLPRSLASGPDGIVDLQQAASQPSSPLSVKYFPPASASTPPFSLTDIPSSPKQQPQEQEQRVPIHRKVTLFRSKTLSMYKSSSQTTSSLPPSSSHTKDNTIETTPSNGMAAADDHDDDYKNNSENPSTRANSLPSRRRRQRDSLRLANGHGLDFDTFLPSTAYSGAASTSTEEEASAAAVERSNNDLESALPGASLGRSTGPPVFSAIVTTGGRLSDIDQQQKARRQIISLLAMGRKDRISAKTGHVMKSGSSTCSSPSTPTTACASASASTPTTPLSQLSPLALEAQEELFVSPGAGVRSEEKMKTKGGAEDPCEKIAFMLVPKSRYEFQPLVVA